MQRNYVNAENAICTEKACFFFWLIASVLQEDIDQVDIIPSIKSDHSTIVLVINGVDPPFGNLIRAYWMTNMLTR